jgi:hypothetical protein
MFQDLPDYFTVPDEKNKDLYNLWVAAGWRSVCPGTSSTRTGRAPSVLYTCRHACTAYN